MSDLVRIAVIGWGRWGRVCHGLLASTTPGCALHAVVSGDAEKRAKVETEHGCRTYATPAKAFADDAVDLVVLATPNDAHADLACAALAAGKHVLVDKPLAPTLAECDRMIGAAQDAGRTLCVFNNRRYDGDFRTARRLVDDGRLGDLRWAEMAWQGGGAPGGWRGDAMRGGGRFIDLGSHLIDQLLLLIPDRIEGVYCRLMREFEHKDVESDALLIVHFAGGATGVIDCSSRAAIPKPRFYLRGTEATFEKFGLDPQEDALPDGIDAVRAARPDPADDGRLRAISGGKLSSRPDDAEQIDTLPGDWPALYADLRDAVVNGTPPPVPAAEARRVVAVFDAALRSAETGRVVAVDGG